MLITPALQQLSICMLYGVSGSKSTIAGLFLQEWGVLGLKLEQSPCSVACARDYNIETTLKTCPHRFCQKSQKLGTWLG
jgi:hypothetical protein